MEVRGAAPGLPGPEALDTEWSSSSSEESPEYATKPVFNFLATGSERGISKGGKRTKRTEDAERGGGEKQTPKQQQPESTKSINAKIEGEKSTVYQCRGWGPPLVGRGVTVTADQSSGRTAARDESCPAPTQNPASPRQKAHGREGEHREKEKNTKTGEDSC